MSESPSSIGKMIGGEPSQRKTIETFSKDRFDHQVFLKGEREKTPTEEAIIDLANEVTDALRMRYGIEPFPVPSKNIHVIKMEEWGNGKESGRTNYVDQNILMVEWASRLLFAKEVLHELIHFKSMMIWELKDGDLDKKGLFLTEAPSSDFPEGRQTSVLDYRIGLRVRSRPEGKRHFDAFNEAIAEELAKKILEGWRTNPLFSGEWEQTQRLMQENQLEDKECIYLEEVEDDRIRGMKFTYKQERQVLHLLIQKLFERNSDRYKDTEEIFDLFVKNCFTGKLLELGTLIDRTFGVGTFRKIGEYDADAEGLEKYIVSLS